MFKWLRRGFERCAKGFGWARLLGSVLLLGLLALRIWDPVPLELLRLKTFDLYQTIKPRVVTKRPVVIVDIDEASLASVGQWPWPRTVVAELVHRITDGGGIAMAFDIVFAEPDRTSPQLIAKALPELSEQARAEIRRARDHDEVLADALLRSRVVLAQSAYVLRRGQARTGTPPKTPIATLGGDPSPFLLKYPEHLANIKVLEDAAHGRGMVTVLPDWDGVVRRVPVVLRAKDKILPSLTAELLRVAKEQNTIVIKTGQAGVRSVVVGGREIPTDANGQLWVYFSDHDPRRFISAKDVLDGSVSFDKLAGKLVLIGTSAAGLFDLKATPNDPAMPGVEVHTQVLENVLTQTILTRPPYALGAEVTAATIVGLLIILLVPILGASRVFFLGVLLALILAGASYYLFASHGLLIDATFPLVSSFAVFLTLLFLNYLRGEMERREIRNAFAHYLSPDLIEQLADDPDKLALGGETKEMTILFSDVRNFTAISETFKQNPQGLTSLMNRFLTPLSNAILERRGTIDKYMGDAIMAFWNAPIDDTDHAVHACEAGLDMLDRLERVNKELENEAKQNARDYAPLRAGIGSGTGDAVVGNMGSEVRFDYSAMGDTVNLASRLEGQTKNYGVPLIINAKTAEQVNGRFALIELDAVRVKGRAEPEVIYALVGRHGTSDEGKIETLQAGIGKLLVCYRDRDWDGAVEVLSLCKKHGYGVDFNRYFDLFGSRIEQFRRNPPPADWDGVFELETK